MKGKELNSGIRGGLWDEKHRGRMSDAVWLFGWAVHRQTREEGRLGWVLGGMTLTFQMISDDTGFPVGTLKRWMETLTRERYLNTERVMQGHQCVGMRIFVLNAKKFSSISTGVVSNLSPPHPKSEPRGGLKSGSVKKLNLRTSLIERKETTRTTPFLSEKERQTRSELYVGGGPEYVRVAR